MAVGGGISCLRHRAYTACLFPRLRHISISTFAIIMLSSLPLCRSLRLSALSPANWHHCREPTASDNLCHTLSERNLIIKTYQCVVESQKESSLFICRIDIQSALKNPGLLWSVYNIWKMYNFLGPPCILEKLCRLKSTTLETRHLACDLIFQNFERI